MEHIVKDDELYFAKIREKATIPSKKDEDAGYDTYADFAEELFVTESTIKKHTGSIFAKFNVTNRFELYAKLKKYI